MNISPDFLRWQLETAIADQHRKAGEPAGVSKWPFPTEWPEWAKKLKAQKWPGETNVVETIDRLYSNHGADAFKVWWAETFGAFKPCPHCAALRDIWRRNYAYVD